MGRLWSIFVRQNHKNDQRREQTKLPLMTPFALKLQLKLSPNIVSDVIHLLEHTHLVVYYWSLIHLNGISGALATIYNSWDQYLSESPTEIFFLSFELVFIISELYIGWMPHIYVYCGCYTKFAHGNDKSTLKPFIIFKLYFPFVSYEEKKVRPN